MAKSDRPRDDKIDLVALDALVAVTLVPSIFTLAEFTAVAGVTPVSAGFAITVASIFLLRVWTLWKDRHGEDSNIIALRMALVFASSCLASGLLGVAGAWAGAMITAGFFLGVATSFFMWQAAKSKRSFLQQSA